MSANLLQWKLRQSTMTVQGKLLRLLSRWKAPRRQSRLRNRLRRRPLQQHPCRPSDLWQRRCAPWPLCRCFPLALRLLRLMMTCTIIQCHSRQFRCWSLVQLTVKCCNICCRLQHRRRRCRWPPLRGTQKIESPRSGGSVRRPLCLRPSP